MIFISDTTEQKTKADIEKVILDLVSQWGGVTSEELKNALHEESHRAANVIFKGLLEKKVVRKVYYITQQESRWVLN